MWRSANVVEVVKPDVLERVHRVHEEPRAADSRPSVAGRDGSSCPAASGFAGRCRSATCAARRGRTAARVHVDRRGRCLPLPVPTVYGQVRAGRLPARLIARSWRLRRDEVAAFADSFMLGARPGDFDRYDSSVRTGRTVGAASRPATRCWKRSAGSWLRSARRLGS